jgi:hypothetical protein
MEKERNTDFIKIEGGLILNVNHIRWIRKVHDCMYICTKSDGCTSNTSHVICGSNEQQNNDFERLNTMFR